MKYLILAVAVASLAGCSTQSERLAKCESQGISKDTCYLAEQNRITAINAAAEKQALENASNAVQHSQSAHKQASYKQLTREAEAVINGPISSGAEFLLAQGWKPNNGVWKKQGYTLQLIVEDGIVLNAQLTK